jgi:hypothetical protein
VHQNRFWERKNYLRDKAKHFTLLSQLLQLFSFPAGLDGHAQCRHFLSPVATHRSWNQSQIDEIKVTMCEIWTTYSDVESKRY